MDSIFPYKKGVDYANIKTTREGSYSVTHKQDSARILGIIKQCVKDLSLKTITDLTGGIGGDTIQFAMHFKKVHSIEMNPENFEVLRHNVELFDFDNVQLHSGDATKLFTWKTDVLFMDPPWGGPAYKQQKSLELYLGTKLVSTWINEVLARKNRPSHIFLKLPSNFKLISLSFLENVLYVKTYKIRNYLLVHIY